MSEPTNGLTVTVDGLAGRWRTVAYARDEGRWFVVVERGNKRERVWWDRCAVVEVAA